MGSIDKQRQFGRNALILAYSLVIFHDRAKVKLEPKQGKHMEAETEAEVMEELCLLAQFPDLFSLFAIASRTACLGMTHL